MNIFIAIAALVASAFPAFGLFKAGSFKSKASKDVLLGAGMGWVKNLNIGVVRLVAWLEMLGAIGAIVAPLGAYATGFEWSKWVGVAAIAGLALTMVFAIVMHGVRGELKYTAKANFSLLIPAIAGAVLQAFVELPLL